MQLGTIVDYLQSLEIHVDFQGDPSHAINQVAGLDSAKPENISFLTDKKYLSCLADSQAGAVILSAEHAESCNGAYLIVENPYYVYALVAQFLNQPAELARTVHPSAFVDSYANLADTVRVEAQAAIHDNVQIGEGTDIGSGVVIESHVKIGANCRIGANVVICHNCVIGDDVIIEAGSVIGGDGFGWANNRGEWVKIPQLGRVVIGDSVSIGNNCSIDRGAIEDTIIENNCIIDNQVHIAHNVTIGSGSAIAGQVGFAGSSKLGKNCTVAGQVGFAGHIEITDNCHFLAKAGITHSIQKPGAYAGFPAISATEWQKNSVRARNLDKLSKQLKQLQKQIDALQSASEEEQY